MGLHFSAVHLRCDSWIDEGSSEGLKDQRIPTSHSLTDLDGTDIAQCDFPVSESCLSMYMYSSVWLRHSTNAVFPPQGRQVHVGSKAR